MSSHLLVVPGPRPAGPVGASDETHQRGHVRGNRGKNAGRLLVMTLRKVGAIRAWVCKQTVGLVKRLTGVERVLRTEAQALPSIDLELGERIREGWPLSLPVSRASHHRSGLAADPRLD